MIPSKWESMQTENIEEKIRCYKKQREGIKETLCPIERKRFETVELKMPTDSIVDFKYFL